MSAQRPTCTFPACQCTGVSLPQGNKAWHCPKQAAHSKAVLDSLCANLPRDFAEKTARNARVQARYDELRVAGKHGHYECMFRVVHEEVKRGRDALAVLVRLHDEHLNAEPPLEERSEQEYSRWAYAMSDAWDAARAVLCENDAETIAEKTEKSR